MCLFHWRDQKNVCGWNLILGQRSQKKFKTGFQTGFGLTMGFQTGFGFENGFQISFGFQIRFGTVKQKLLIEV